MQSLSVKYRPQTFEECCGQKYIVTILKKQLETQNIVNCYLFAGPSGCGKTTLSRILAKEINKGYGTPIEIDGATYNGVDNVRSIIDDAKTRSLDSQYKVFIIDEVHSLTTQAWQSFLKCLEEPPKYTIFIFCTTEPQKIPTTILNRVMRFNLTKLDTIEIYNRLKYICQCEQYSNYEEACDYIAKISAGGMRDAIATLEKCAAYSTNLSIDNVLEALGSFAYETFFDLTSAIFEGNKELIIKIIEYCYNKGNDLTLFITQYLDFLLDLEKYGLFEDIHATKIPSYLIEDLEAVSNAENFVDRIKKLMTQVLELINELKHSTIVKTTIIVTLLNV